MAQDAVIGGRLPGHVEAGGGAPLQDDVAGLLVRSSTGLRADAVASAVTVTGQHLSQGGIFKILFHIIYITLVHSYTFTPTWNI